MDNIHNLINNLDKNKKKTKNMISIPNFIFGNEMDDSLFLSLFENTLKDIYNQKSENAGGIKSFFNKMKFVTLHSIFNNEYIISKIKKDIIIHLLIDKRLYNDKPNINLTEYLRIIKAANDEEFGIKNIILEFNEVSLKNGQKCKLDKVTLKQFLKSEAIISAIEETLKHFEDDKISKAGRNILNNKCDEFIENTKFYSINLNNNHYAFTIYNGNIFINKKYIDISNDNNDKKQLSALAIILFSIIHEFINYLVRTLSDDETSRNYFLKTKNRIKKLEKIEINESGNFLERLLIGNYYGFFSIDAEFLLDIKNYNVAFNIFCNNFLENNRKNYLVLDEETFLQKGNSLADTFLMRGRCFLSVLRGCDV